MYVAVTRTHVDADFSKKNQANLGQATQIIGFDRTAGLCVHYANKYLLEKPRRALFYQWAVRTRDRLKDICGKHAPLSTMALVGVLLNLIFSGIAMYIVVVEISVCLIVVLALGIGELGLYQLRKNMLDPYLRHACIEALLHVVGKQEQDRYAPLNLTGSFTDMEELILDSLELAYESRTTTIPEGVADEMAWTTSKIQEFIGTVDFFKVRDEFIEYVFDRYHSAT